VIDRCFESDRDFAINILRRPAIAFYNIHPLKLAVRANCRAFLASHCVQKYLDNEWYEFIDVNLIELIVCFNRFGNINYKRQNINFRVMKFLH
jgi:hypothetical protein